MSQRRDSSRDASLVAPDFVDATDFTLAFTAAKRAAVATFGERWDLNPGAHIWARLPTAWVRVKVAGRVAPGLHPPSKFVRSASPIDSSTPRERLPDEAVGERWSQAPRDQKLPVARFWPNGCLPVGPVYAGAGTPAAAVRSAVRPSARLLAHTGPEKPRRPAGIGLPSGFERAENDFYVEPRWLVDALLQVEQFDGSIHDPFCGGGNIVGACLQQGLLATGSDRFDRGFGERRDAFDITEPLDNVISNPPFARAEDAARHFLPLVRRKLVLLARLNILEGQERQALFRASPPARMLVSSRRASIPPGDLAHPRDQFGAVVPLPASGGSTAYCWVVWSKDHAGPPTLGWI